jgi:hypothetical protein
MEESGAASERLTLDAELWCSNWNSSALQAKRDQGLRAIARPGIRPPLQGSRKPAHEAEDLTREVFASLHLPAQRSIADQHSGLGSGLGHCVAGRMGTFPQEGIANLHAAAGRTDAAEHIDGLRNERKQSLGAAPPILSSPIGGDCSGKEKQLVPVPDQHPESLSGSNLHCRICLK